jgi:type II secretory pathway component PulF
MTLFEYQAIDQTGKTRKGKIEAESSRQANVRIKAQGLHPLAIATTKKTAGTKRSPGKPSHGRSKVPHALITSFARQLSVLVNTGIPYDKALEILIEESHHPSFQYVLAAIKARIVEGSSLAVALEDHPQLFPKMFVAMVRAGEAGGTLGQVLDFLTVSRERHEEITAKIQKALIYPMIMTFIGLGIVVFMITFIIPRIIPVFLQFDLELPLPTRIVITVSDSVVQNWWLYLLVVAGIAWLFRLFRLTNRGEKLMDQWVLHIPVIKGILRQTIIFRFTQTLCTLLKSGVELKHSLGITRNALGNRTYEDQFDQITLDITQKGRNLSLALRRSGIFPLSMIQMIRIGEESGQLEDMLEKVSVITEKDLRQSLDKSIALIEPLLILWMALMVGFLILAVMLPMIEMNRLI